MDISHGPKELIKKSEWEISKDLGIKAFRFNDIYYDHVDKLGSTFVSLAHTNSTMKS